MRLYPRGKRGIWWFDTTVAGKRITKSTGTTSRQQAEEFASRIAAEAWRTRRLGEKPRVTFGQAVMDWLSVHGEDRRSIETMKDRLRWLAKHLENMPISAITADKLSAILMLKEGSNASRNRLLAEVSKILHHAHRKAWIDAVPAFHRFPEAKSEPRWLTREQADRLIAELPAHLADMAQFSLATGLRESNVRLLRWSQVDMDRRVAWVLGRETKNGRALSVPLNADALAVLKRQPKGIFVFTYRDKKKVDGKLTLGEPHTVWNCSSAAWYKAVKRAGLEGFRWHDLRHTWASWHVQAGTRLPDLMALGGWSSYEMVLRYAHLNPGSLSGVADAVLRNKSVTTATSEDAKMPQVIDSMGWLMGLEPTTTGITKRQSTAKVLNLNDALARKRRKVA